MFRAYIATLIANLVDAYYIYVISYLIGMIPFVWVSIPKIRKNHWIAVKDNKVYDNGDIKKDNMYLNGIIEELIPLGNLTFAIAFLADKELSPIARELAIIFFVICFIAFTISNIKNIKDTKFVYHVHTFLMFLGAAIVFYFYFIK